MARKINKIWAVVLRYENGTSMYKSFIETETDMPNDIYQKAREVAAEAKNSNLPGVKSVYVGVTQDCYGDVKWNPSTGKFDIHVISSVKTAQQIADDAIFWAITSNFNWEKETPNMSTSTVKSVHVVNQKNGEFGQMVVEFDNGLIFSRSLTRDGKYQFLRGTLYSICVPTVESVQNAINYVGDNSDSLAAHPKGTATCPHCGGMFDIAIVAASALGSRTSEKKAAAARANAAKPRPGAQGKPKPRKPKSE